MCCSKFFLSLARSHRRLIWKYAILCGLWTRTVSKRLLLQPPFGFFFNFSFFFVLSLKRRLILLFVSVFSLCHLLVSMLRCLYFSSFLCRKFFFVFPQILHSGFGRLYQSSDALVGGIVGIWLTPFFVIIFFFGNSFFFLYDATKNNQSFSFGCQRGRISNKEISSYLINDCDNICEFLLVKCNKMKNTHSIE